MSIRAVIIVTGIMFMMAGVTNHCYSEDSSEINETVTAGGTVTSVDWVGSVLAVNDVEFSVPSNVEVRKGNDKTGFADINVGDDVTVTYTKERDGSLKAVRIVVAYSGEIPV